MTTKKIPAAEASRKKHSQAITESQRTSMSIEKSEPERMSVPQGQKHTGKSGKQPTGGARKSEREKR